MVRERRSDKQVLSSHTHSLTSLCVLSVLSVLSVLFVLLLFLSRLFIQTTPVCVRDLLSGCRGTPRVLEEAPSSWTFPPNVQIVALADTDSDGDMDMVACVGSEDSPTPPPRLSYYENMAGAAAAAPIWVARMEWSLSGTALQCVPRGTSAEKEGQLSIVLTDSRNTGLLDILVGSPLQNLTLFQNVGTDTNPDWNFDTKTTPTSKEQRGSGEGTHVEVWLESIHSIARSLVPVTVFLSFPQVNLVDMDGDGDSDLIISGSLEGGVNGNSGVGEYLINVFDNIRPTHSVQQTTPSYSLAGVAIKKAAAMYGFYTIGLADLDNDLDVDILLWNQYTEPRFIMFENTGSRFEAVWTKHTNVQKQLGFRTPVFYAGDVSDFDFRQIVLADLNNDKSVDLCYGGTRPYGSSADPAPFDCFKRSSASAVDHFVRRPTKESGWPLEEAVFNPDDPSTYSASFLTADLGGHGRKDVVFFWPKNYDTHVVPSENGKVFQNLGSVVPGRDMVSFAETTVLLEIKDINAVELSPDAKVNLFFGSGYSSKNLCIVFLDVTNDGHLDLVALVIDFVGQVISSCELQVYARTSPLPNNGGGVEKFVFSRSPSFDIDISGDLNGSRKRYFSLVLPQTGTGKNRPQPSPDLYIVHVDPSGSQCFLVYDLLDSGLRRIQALEKMFVGPNYHCSVSGITFGDVTNDGFDDAVVGDSYGMLFFFEQVTPFAFANGTWPNPEWHWVQDWSVPKIQLNVPLGQVQGTVAKDAANGEIHPKIGLSDYDGDGDLDLLVSTVMSELMLFEANVCSADCTSSGSCDVLTTYAPACACFGTGTTEESSCNSCQAGAFFTESNSISHAGSCSACGAGKHGQLIHTRANETTTCRVCPAGYTQNTLVSGTCEACAAGQYQDSNMGAVACLPCAPGSYNGVKGQPSCTSCPKNTFTNSSQQTSCMVCRRGEKAEPGSARCSKCDAGESGTGTNGTCAKCDLGRYRTSDDVVTDSCRLCPSGRYTDQNGQAACFPCLPGKHEHIDRANCGECAIARYQNEAAKSSCKSCALGRAPDITGSTSCLPCFAGKFEHKNANDETICTDCGAGQYTDSSNAPKCKACPLGEHQNDLGKTACLPCLPGKYGRANPTDRSDCNACEAGTASADSGRKTPCEQSGAGTIVLGGGTTSVKVPDGSYLTECSGGVCTGFEACPIGWSSGTQLETLRSCKACAAGQTSSAAATECRDCTKGRFGTTDSSGAGLCDSCPSGYFQPAETSATSCTSCPTGWSQESGGESSCKDLGGIKPENCGDDEYWVPDKGKTGKSGCLECPLGGSCLGAIEIGGIQTLFGWSKCPNLNLTYSLCAFGAACNGAKNDLLVNKYVDEFGHDPATVNLNASCSTFYKNNSLLCAACADDYSRAGSSSKCEKCPPPSGNVILAILGSLAGIIGLFVLTAMNLSDKGKVDPSDGAKSIGLSFVQVITLLTSFPIAWPQIFVDIFQVGGAVTTMGQHLVNFKCFYPERSEAEVFYTTAVVWAIVPFLLPLASVMVWLLLSKTRDVKDLQSKMKATVVGLLYLIWPTLVSTTFSLFSCSSVCDQTLFRIDLEEQCWEGRHAAYAFVLGLPMLLFFVLGFPMIAMVMVQRLHSKVRETKKTIAAAVAAATVSDTNNETSNDINHTTKGKHHRWFSNVHVVENITSAQMSTHEAFGVLYTSFREEVWWWEMTVTIRKIVIVGIGVFGESMGEMQVHVTLLCIVIVLLCTAIVQPYGKRRLLNYLELFTLTAIWLTLWAGNVFNANPRCEDGKGGTVAWCDTISIAVGMIDVIMVIAVAATMVYYKKQKQCDAFLSSRSHDKLEEEEEGSSMESTGVTSFTNPTLDAATASNAPHVNIEMIPTHHNDSGSKIPDNWDMHESEEGEIFYEDRLSGVTQW
jgi:hypothetical protein